jgi:hypothetical protein
VRQPGKLSNLDSAMPLMPLPATNRFEVRAVPRRHHAPIQCLLNRDSIGGAAPLFLLSAANFGLAPGTRGSGRHAPSEIRKLRLEVVHHFAFSLPIYIPP